MGQLAILRIVCWKWAKDPLRARYFGVAQSTSSMAMVVGDSLDVFLVLPYKNLMSKPTGFSIFAGDTIS